MSDFEALARVITNRRSCRGFTSQAVAREVIESLLQAAQRTASWCNTQPWQLHIVSGRAKDELSAVLIESAGQRVDGPPPADIDFPAAYTGVYAERRREVGWQLYDAMGVAKGDRKASAQQARRNFEFFGAPHVAIVTTDADLGSYGAIDCGLYVNSFMLVAEALGLGTCAQAAIARVSPAVRDFLDLPADRLVVCGISFGYPDPEHPSAQFTSGRAAVSEVVTYVD